jgi:mannose-6-phosphate isomerase-like protein (cupin superfamily)
VSDRPAAGVHDALVTPLALGGSGVHAVLSFDDHLLRRFGAAQVVRLDAGDRFRALRVTADEVWVLLEGAAEVRLEDTRPDSPTHDVRQAVALDAPTRLLVPFGVRFEVEARPRAVLLRFMTHTEREDPPTIENP